MDALLLARLQFGLTAMFHFLFPPLTIGLATIIALIEFLYWRSDKPIYDKMARFWSKLFVINFTVGVATGITMEFQFGANWAQYSRFVGDIFGAPLAAEGVLAFFLESTFFGLLIFGRDKISKRMRFIAASMVALGSILSAFWIIVANSWQQTPAGYSVEGGRAVLTDFAAAVFNPSTLPRYFHTIDSAFLTGAFFVLGVSAYFLLKGKFQAVAKNSFKIALVFAICASLLQVFIGDLHAKQVAATQPAKLAAFEGLWETKTQAPLLLVGIPDPAHERNSLGIGVPGMLSWLAHGDVNSQVKGLKEFPVSDRPPVKLLSKLIEPAPPGILGRDVAETVTRICGNLTVSTGAGSESEKLLPGPHAYSALPIFSWLEDVCACAQKHMFCKLKLDRLHSPRSVGS